MVGGNRGSDVTHKYQPASDTIHSATNHFYVDRILPYSVMNLLLILITFGLLWHQ